MWQCATMRHTSYWIIPSPKYEHTAYCIKMATCYSAGNVYALKDFFLGKHCLK